jgi:hypothetical protein
MRSTGIGVVACDAFATAPEAVRICLGGPASRVDIRHALEYAAHALEELPVVRTSAL